MCPRPTPGPKSKGGSTLNNMRSLLYWDGELYDGCFLFSTIERACPELVADLLCSHQPLWRNNGRSTKTQRNLLWPRALRSRATIHNLCAHLVDEGIGAAWPHPASGNLLTLLGNTSTSRATEEQCQGPHVDRGHDRRIVDES